MEDAGSQAPRTEEDDSGELPGIQTLPQSQLTCTYETSKKMGTVATVAMQGKCVDCKCGVYVLEDSKAPVLQEFEPSENVLNSFPNLRFLNNRSNRYK